MSFYLNPLEYEDGSDMNKSDQITVSAEVWKVFDREHGGDEPMFVEVGPADSGVFGRLIPSVSRFDEDSCRVPQWMARRLDLEPGTWIGMTARALPVAGTLVLRARQEATLTGCADPVAMITDALTGKTGQSWACVSVGAELPLTCGTFDVIEIRSVEDFAVPAACILNCDVELDIVPALDHKPPAPVPAPYRETTAASTTHAPAPAPAPAPGRNRGYIPFSGVGYRLDGK